jgi:hypothetical protein
MHWLVKESQHPRVVWAALSVNPATFVATKGNQDVRPARRALGIASIRQIELSQLQTS